MLMIGRCYNEDKSFNHQYNPGRSDRNGAK